MRKSQIYAIFLWPMHVYNDLLLKYLRIHALSHICPLKYTQLQFSVHKKPQNILRVVIYRYV